MLKALPRYDNKWMKTDLQVRLLVVHMGSRNIQTEASVILGGGPGISYFPGQKPLVCWYNYSYLTYLLVQIVFSEDGLSKLWNELVRDGEIQAANRDKKEEEAENVKERKSPFDVFLEEWTWGQVRI